MIHTTPIANCVLSRTSPERQLRGGFAHQQPVDVVEHAPELPLGAGDALRSAHHCARGFTLVELMVAIAVTAILIVAVNQIFGSVSDGVSRGLALSEIMASARVIGDQIERDFEQMIGPGENGVLAIAGYEANSYVDNDDEEAGIAKRDVRSDQILFIRRRGEADPVTPQADNTYDGYSSAAYTRVWYGHALRTETDGTDPGDDLGVADTPNEFAIDWILGRQALFLNQDGSSGHRPFSVYAQGGTTTANVNGYSNPVGSPRIWHGVTDVALYGLDTPNATYGCMVGTAEKGTSETIGDTRLQKADSATAYALKMYEYLFVTQRLLCNPKPSGTTYDSWRIAQMHPYLSGHVSDFIVEFAGDYDPVDGELDTTVTVDAEQIRWYGFGNQPDGDLDGTSFQRGSSAMGQKPVFIPTPSPDLADKLWIFRHGSGNTNWPSMIRFRYRVHDARGKLSGVDGDLGIWFEQIVTVPRE